MLVNNTITMKERIKPLMTPVKEIGDILKVNLDG